MSINIFDISKYIDMIISDHTYSQYVNFYILLLTAFVLYIIFLTRNLSKLISGSINGIALLSAIGGTIAFVAGSIKLIYDAYSFMEIDIENFEEVFLKLINFAEYLLIGITFFSIAKRLIDEPYFHLENNADQTETLTDVPDLEKHIIGMVVATISVAFIGFVVSTKDVDTCLKFGIGIGIFITSLGLYIKLSSSHKNEATLDILQQEVMQLHTKENESLQEITKLKSDIKDINSKSKNN
jgi:hypothetical protein